MMGKPSELLISLSQPWFKPKCEECQELVEVKITNGVAAICSRIEAHKPCEYKEKTQKWDWKDLEKQL